MDLLALILDFILHVDVHLQKVHTTMASGFMPFYS